MANQPTLEDVKGLEQAYTRLSDFQAAQELLETERLRYPEATSYFSQRLATLYTTMASETHYRLSKEARQGYSIDEYITKYKALAASILNKEGLPPLPAATPPQVPTPVSAPPQAGNATLCGVIVDEAGNPLPGVTLVLGLESLPIKITEQNTQSIGYSPRLPEMRSLNTVTDATGQFRFEQVPEGIHDYLAVRLDPSCHAIPTRFIARSIAVGDQGEVNLGTVRTDPWKSAPAAASTSAPAHPHALAQWEVRNPFAYEFPRQPITFSLPEGVTSETPVHALTNYGPEATQIVDGELFLLTRLEAESTLTLQLLPGSAPASPLRYEDKGTYWEIETGAATFQIAGNDGPRQPPILAMRGADRLWRGKGRFRLPAGVEIIGGSTTVLENGPVLLRIASLTHFSNGSTYRLELTALAGEPLLLAKEQCTALEGAAFEFSLKEFSGGRGYLHWLREKGSFHWSTLEKADEIKAILPEQVPWWIPPQGFGYALTMDGLESEDYLGIFSIRRGEWIDRAFEELAHGPINRDGSPNPELDWPYPEMVGSSISPIHVCTDTSGDVFFAFNWFEGERQWGLLASSFSANDGPYKEISRKSHAYTVPRLRDFQHWNLDQPDQIERPSTLIERAALPTLRQKTQRYPGLWKALSQHPCEGPQEGVIFAIEGNPELAWRIRTNLLAIARVRSRATLLGRDWSDMYSPVGGRAITHLVHEYDLVAASGVFTVEEEQLVRSFFILMGQLFMEKDFMNWGFNARNANFEADRAEIVGTIGLIFEGHPDGEKMMQHAQERLRTMLSVYCNPESGKWYENPACYYRVACRSWSNLAVSLAKRGRLQLADIPSMRQFLLWGVVLLTPPVTGYQTLRDGDATRYEEDEKFRKVPPIGDHAGAGHSLMGHYYSTAKAWAKEDPAFGQQLLDAFYAANPYAARFQNNGWEKYQTPPERPTPYHQTQEAGLLSFFIDIEDDGLRPPLKLDSHRLSGFGAVLRNRVGTAQEDYLLIKQGPGGYRYHRTEGSFLLFAEGKPLVYDGGEAGETWRHSTLSFGDVHMPISAGRVERYFADPAFHFVQGIHPEVIRPGAPVFLSDVCHHNLVEECYRRFEKQDPALVRSFAWVGSEYLIISDHLRADTPSHWHLQVVADQAVETQPGDYHFQGRHGVDLQVLFPGTSPQKEVLEPLPVYEYRGDPKEWVSMMHLQVADPSEKGYLALLRPLSPLQPEPLKAQRLDLDGTHIGLHVTGTGIDDTHWFYRGNPLETPDFSGTYGARLLRPDRQSVWLGGEGRINLAEGSLTASAGIQTLFWQQTPEGETLRAEGNGTVTINLQGKARTFSVQGTQLQPVLAASLNTIYERAERGETLQVTFFGGSLTWGAMASDPHTTSYRALISQQLQAAYPKAQWRFKDAAIGGLGTESAVYRIERDLLTPAPDLVFLDFTVNDGPHGEPPPGKLAAYETIIRSLAIRNIPAVMSLFPVRRDFDQPAPARPLDHWHQELAQAYQIPITDVVSFMQQRQLETGIDPDLWWPMKPDRTHPGDAGYALFAEAIWNTLQNARYQQCQLPEEPLHPPIYQHRERIQLTTLPLPTGWQTGQPSDTGIAFDFTPSRWLDTLVIAPSPQGDSPEPQPFRLTVRAERIALWGEANPTSGPFAVSINGGEPKLFEVPPSAAKGPMRYFIQVAEGLDPAVEHEIVILPMLQPGQELQLESICTARPEQY